MKEYVERKENCHDKCLMSLALALPKQNKSVIEIYDENCSRYDTSDTQSIFFRAERFTNHQRWSNKRWESFMIHSSSKDASCEWEK